MCLASITRVMLMFAKTLNCRNGYETKMGASPNPLQMCLKMTSFEFVVFLLFCMYWMECFLLNLIYCIKSCILNEFTGSPREFSTVAELVKFITMVIFTYSGLHSAVPSGQFHY